MNQAEARRLLLECDAGGSTAAVNIPDIIRRDRMKEQVLTVATTIAWIAAIVMLLYFFVVILKWSSYPLEARLLDEAAKRGVSVEDLPKTGITETTIISMLMICTLGSMSVAVVCTLVLVFAVRRFALRRMNASLREISNQLKQLIDEKYVDKIAGSSPT